jgi:hypothetical protein
MNDPSRMKLESAIRECNAHRDKLERGHGLLSAFFPLTVDSFPSLDEERTEHVDQFIYRFSKLQDAMGKRLLPTLYVILEEDESPRPFIDILLRLEKLGIMQNAEEWQVLRNIRNTIAHEYPGSIEQTVTALNLLYEMWPALRRMYEHVRLAATSRI